MGRLQSWAPQGVKQLPCHLLPGVMSRRGTTNRPPCPACLVNTSRVRSLVSMALLCSCRHPPQRQQVSIYTQAQPKESFLQGTRESQLQSIRPQCEWKHPKPSTWDIISRLPALETKNMQHGARQGLVCLCFPPSHPPKSGSIELCQGLSPSPGWSHPTLDVPESASRRSWHHWLKLGVAGEKAGCPESEK